MLETKDFLELGSNLIDPKGENNIKLAEMLTGVQAVGNKLYEGLMSINVLDELVGVHLDNYGAKFGILRQGLSDDDFRALIKALSIVKFRGNTYNALVKAIATFLKVPLTSVSLEEIGPEDTGYPRFTLIKHIVIKAAVDHQKMLSLFYNIKAAGVIVACYKYQVSIYKTYYGNMFYTATPFQTFSVKNCMIDCNGVVTDAVTGEQLEYEYDLHEFDLDELQDLNE